ncbi:ABC-type dipeptide/oligopeptide/nickel transport system permease subunit [Neisseria perflava]|uniref:DUF2523 family protein n=1 Tax=Neisseria perflava TaxID=33053 RepID=UPI00209DF287|nr:DUF2523 family protein [Neisseria perflava]MCP1773448.1 ABC-type dipeptide/oligopeptide/nickel transport system permease subunit [Neisseria perflava]
MPAVLVALIASLTVKFVVQLCLSLGIAIVTYVGYQKGLEMLKNNVVESINVLPETIYDLLMLAGVGQGLGWIFGAMTFYAGMKATSKLKFAYWGD